jgi:hypothetical protein
MYLRICELFYYVLAALFIRLEIPFQYIGKEKDPKNGKQDKEFDQDDPP